MGRCGGLGQGNVQQVTVARRILFGENTTGRGRFDHPCLGGGPAAVRPRRTSCVTDRVHGMVHAFGRSTRGTGFGARRLAIGCALALAAAAPVAGQRGDTIRNTNPQRAIDETTIYHIDCFLPLGAEADVYEEGTPERILLRFADHFTAGQYERAAPLAEQLSEMAPHRPEGPYNLACTLARMRLVDQAFEALEEAVARGYRNVAHLRHDPDLAHLRGEARFTELLADVARLIADERPPVGPLRHDDPATIVRDLRNAAPGILERHAVPGVTMALIHDRRWVWTGTFGASCAEGDSIAVDTLFPTTSPARLTVLLASAQQADEGSLDLTRAVLAARHRGPSAIDPVSTRDGRRDLIPTEVVVALRDAVEVSADHLYRDYCRTRIFRPLEMSDARFRCNDDAAERIAHGHNVFGTSAPAVVSPVTPIGTTMYTTAGDLGRLLAGVIGGADDAAFMGAPLFGMLDPQDAELVTELGLGIGIEPTAYGTRVTIGDTDKGVGCLIRWYPDAGTGVAILYNAESGRPAAEHLAQIALGGDV